MHRVNFKSGFDVESGLLETKTHITCTCKQVDSHRSLTYYTNLPYRKAWLIGNSTSV